MAEHTAESDARGKCTCTATAYRDCFCAGVTPAGFDAKFSPSPPLPAINAPFTDFDGRPLAVGDRIFTLGWGDGVRLVHSGAWATVVGFARTRIRVQFDGWAYGGKHPDFDSIGRNRRVYARKAEHYTTSTADRGMS